VVMITRIEGPAWAQNREGEMLAKRSVIKRELQIRYFQEFTYDIIYTNHTIACNHTRPSEERDT